MPQGTQVQGEETDTVHYFYQPTKYKEGEQHERYEKPNKEAYKKG